jgi:hypothetical protein
VNWVGGVVLAFLFRASMVVFWKHSISLSFFYCFVGSGIVGVPGF